MQHCWAGQYGSMRLWRGWKASELKPLAHGQSLPACCCVYRPSERHALVGATVTGHSPCCFSHTQLSRSFNSSRAKWLLGPFSHGGAWHSKSLRTLWLAPSQTLWSELLSREWGPWPCQEMLALLVISSLRLQNRQGARQLVADNGRHCCASYRPRVDYRLSTSEWDVGGYHRVGGRTMLDHCSPFSGSSWQHVGIHSMRVR